MTYTLDDLTATDEQPAIIEFALNQCENLIIWALAGAAKTSTLQFLAKYMPLQPTLSIAFNKRIVEHMAEGLARPRQTHDGQLHWPPRVVDHDRPPPDGRHCRKKTFNIVKAQIDKLPTESERLDAYDLFSEITAALRSREEHGLCPTQSATWPVAYYARRVLRRPRGSP